MSDESTPEKAQVIKVPNPPYQISWVKDGVVQETIWTSERFAALLLSGAVPVYSEGGEPHIGQTTYDPETNTFTHPSGATYTPAKFELGKT